MSSNIDWNDKERGAKFITAVELFEVLSKYYQS